MSACSRLVTASYRLAMTDGASAASPTRVKLGLISEGIQSWPLYAAQALGFFEREGLAVEVTLTGSSVTQQEALIAGRFDIGFQQADHVVRAVERGSDLFIFMPHGNAPDLTLVAAPDARSIAELRARTIAVDGARSGYALLLRRLLARHGLTHADVLFEEVGGSRERYDAMKRGEVAATLLNPPFDMNLARAGYATLARMSACFPSYPGPVMAARRSWATRHAGVLTAFIRAYDGGYAWLEDRANAERAIAILPERLEVGREAARAALERFARQPRPQITTDGLREVIDVVWEAEGYSEPQGEPGRYMDLSYVERAIAGASRASS